VAINGQVWGWHDEESTAPGTYFDVVRCVSMQDAHASLPSLLLCTVPSGGF
jgi:hypothetical protein